VGAVLNPQDGTALVDRFAPAATENFKCRVICSAAVNFDFTDNRGGQFSSFSSC
jgi:hypothetical protein